MSGKRPDFGLVAVILKFAGANAAPGTQKIDKYPGNNYWMDDGIPLGLFNRKGLGRRKLGRDDGVAKHETLPVYFQRSANLRHFSLRLEVHGRRLEQITRRAEGHRILLSLLN
jgi:hypothetical protein